MSEGEIASSMTGEKAACQMTWHDGGVGMEMVCWWKAESPEAIIEQIGEMNDFFATYNQSRRNHSFLLFAR